MLPRVLGNLLILVGAAAVIDLGLVRLGRALARLGSACRAALVVVNTLAAVAVGAEVVAGTRLDVPVVIRHQGFAAYRPGRYAPRPRLHDTWRTLNPRWKSFTVDTNEDGLRAPPCPAAPPAADERRVMFLGDSFVFGIGLDQGETIPARAERMLAAAAPGVRWTTIDAGVPGYNATSAIDLLEWLADRYRPSVAVFTVQIDDLAPDWNDELRWRAGDLERDLGAGLARFALYRFARAGGSLVRYRRQFERNLDGQLDIRADLLPAQLARLDEALVRLRAIEQRLGVRVVLQVLHRPSGSDGEALRYLHYQSFGAAVEAVVFTPWVAGAPGDTIPVDGHPTPAGAERIARSVVPAIIAATTIAK
jgi:hypothetical protein